MSSKDINDLIKRIVDNPNDSDSYLDLANIYLKNKDFDLAVNVYESLLEVEPENFIALTNLGSIFFYEGEYKKSVNYY